MGKATKGRRKKNDTLARFLRPTEAREAHNDFEDAGAAKRVVPVIDTLLKTGRLSREHYASLAYYRDRAHQAEDDVAQESPLSPERIMGGGGSAYGSKIPVSVLLATPAILDTGRIERELGSLLGITRAIAVEDMSLTRWAISESGGREQTRNGRVEIVPTSPRAVEIALLELRFAAGKIRRA